MIDQLHRAAEPEMTRDCGTCTLCCKVFDVPVLNKPSGHWCGHCKPGQGCAIHATRPQHCPDVFCLRISQTWLGPEWKPSISKIVLTISPLNGMLTAQVDANTPNAWRKDPYYGQLKRWAKFWKAIVSARKSSIRRAGPIGILRLFAEPKKHSLNPSVTATRLS